jgi:hypothetical protein
VGAANCSSAPLTSPRNLTNASSPANCAARCSITWQEQIQTDDRRFPRADAGLWFDSLVMRKLGANVVTSSGSGREAIDGDPNTFWTAGGRGRGADGRSHPHTLTISFTNAVAMNGVTLMNRQNDRDHLRRHSRLHHRVERRRSNVAAVIADKFLPLGARKPSSFDQTESATHLRLTAHSGYGADASAALAEIAVLYAGPPLPENSPPASNTAASAARPRTWTKDNHR